MALACMSQLLLLEKLYCDAFALLRNIMLLKILAHRRKQNGFEPECLFCSFIGNVDCWNKNLNIGLPQVAHEAFSALQFASVLLHLCASFCRLGSVIRNLCNGNIITIKETNSFSFPLTCLFGS